MLNKVTSVAFALVAGSEAFRAASHPFVGEHHDADSVPFEGGTSHRAHEVAIDNKYETLLDRTSKPMRKSAFRKGWEYVFGKSQQELDLEKLVEDNKRAVRYGRGRLGQTVKMEADLKESYGYYARFYMGDRTVMYALIDTATEITAVKSTLCKDCLGEKYNVTQAIQDNNAGFDPKNITMGYGNGQITGNYAKDRVCLTLGECLENFEYLAVSGYKDLNDTKELDALFGWARPERPMLLNPSATPGKEPKFMLQALKDQQFGSEFTTRFQKGSLSWFDIGGASSRQMKGEQV